MKLDEGFFKDIATVAKLTKDWTIRAKSIEKAKDKKEASQMFLDMYEEAKKKAKSEKGVAQKFFVAAVKEIETNQKDVLAAAKKVVSESKQKLDEGMVMMSSLLPVGGVIGLMPERKDNFEFKGLPGQFNEEGVKVLDEMGNKIEEETINEKRDTEYLSPRPKNIINTYFPVRITKLWDYYQVSFGFGNDHTWTIKMKEADPKKIEKTVEDAFKAFEKEMSKLGKIQPFK